MMLIAAIVVAVPILTILSSVAWGWRNGTLVETTQERTDWEFEMIVRHY